MTIFESILLVFLGWLLGLLAPAIHQRILRRYKRVDLIRAVVDEIEGLQFSMVLVAHEIRSRYGELDNEFLAKEMVIMERHGDRPGGSQPFREGLKKLREIPEAQRNTALKFNHDPRVGLHMKQYSLPLVASQIGELSICPLSFQQSILGVRYQLDIYNQIVTNCNQTFDKTFTVQPSDAASVRQNVEVAYRQCGRTAEIIVAAITKLIEDHPAR